MDSSNLSALAVARKNGTESFRRNGQALPYDLLGFWQWSGSDLTNNALRGTIAEYLVACDLGVEGGIRVEWDAYDMKSKQGVKVEVKSAAYLQSWQQAKLSSITFGIQPTLGWDSSTNISGTERMRQADVYIFALLHHQDKLTVDPLNVEQWDFYVLPAAILNEQLPAQKSISLVTLLRLGPERVMFGEVSAAIRRVFPRNDK